MEEEDISKVQSPCHRKRHNCTKGRKSLEDGKIILKQKVEKIAQNTKSTFWKGIKFHNIHHKLQLNLSGMNAELKIWFSN